MFLINSKPSENISLIQIFGTKNINSTHFNKVYIINVLLNTY